MTKSKQISRLNSSSGPITNARSQLPIDPLESTSSQTIINNNIIPTESLCGSHVSIPFDEYEFDPLAYHLKETIGGTNYHIASEFVRMSSYSRTPLYPTISGKGSISSSTMFPRGPAPLETAVITRKAGSLPVNEKPKPITRRPKVPVGCRYLFGGLFCFPLWFLGSIRSSSRRENVWRNWNRVMAAICSFLLLAIIVLAIWSIVAIKLSSGAWKST
ncbi:hypothetical protein DSO57_1005884 [Entomophthora muscae]|uniref:Uncharacterized protein n=1 Tax=Entomophthora muscae TaxID=34485 RepID=A0ACC2RMH7_9FUNG|nr:hypothetical protein DSO57_1005884 [Entomophthora muscae]